MGKPRQRAVDILGLQHQSGRCGSRASGRTSEQTIANGGRPTASRGPFDSTISGKRSAFFGKSVSLPRQKAITQTFDWGYATVSLNTKKIKGLHENDFIMASKIDRLLDRPDGFLDHKQ
jgi:Pterin 4 alpha carbinolamine dehydratase